MHFDIQNRAFSHATGFGLILFYLLRKMSACGGKKSRLSREKRLLLWRALLRRSEGGGDDGFIRLQEPVQCDCHWFPYHSPALRLPSAQSALQRGCNRCAAGVARMRWMHGGF